MWKEERKRKGIGEGGGELEGEKESEEEGRSNGTDTGAKEWRGTTTTGSKAFCALLNITGIRSVEKGARMRDAGTPWHRRMRALATF